MPKFYGQNKKRIDPRYFLNETKDRDKETFNSKGYDKKTGAYGPRGAEEYSTASARDKKVKGQKELDENAAFNDLMTRHSNIESEKLQVISSVVRDILNKTAEGGRPNVNKSFGVVDTLKKKGLLTDPEVEFAKDLIGHTAELHNSRDGAAQVEPEMEEEY